MTSLATIQKIRLIMLMMFMGAIFSLVNQSAAQSVVVEGTINPLEGAKSTLTVSFENASTGRRLISFGKNGDLEVSTSGRLSFHDRGTSVHRVTVTVPNDNVVNNPPRMGEFWVRTGFPASITISVAHEDDEADGFFTLPSHQYSTLTIEEGGNTQQFGVRLTRRPGTNVVLSVSSSDTAVATVMPSSLTFTSSVGDWNDQSRHQVTVTSRAANTDFSDDANFMVTLAVVDEDSYDNYDSLPDKVFNGMVTNPPAPEIQADDLANVDEGSFVNTNVSLSEQPMANVTVTVTSDNGHVESFVPSELIFTSIDYNVGKRVRVNVADNTFVGAVDYEITLSVTGGASEYMGAELVLAGTINDETTDQANLPTAGIEHNAGNANQLGEIFEGGDTDPADNGLGAAAEDMGFTLLGVRLSAQPRTLVTLTTATTSNQIAVSPAELIFDSFNWNSYQMFQIAAVDNAIVGSPDMSYEVTVSVSDGPSRFTGLSALMVTGTIAEARVSNDDDLAGINFAVTQVPALAEDGTTMLGVTLAAEPASDVVVTFSSSFDDSTFSGVAAVSITNDVLTFTSSTWDTQQQVEVGGRDNDVIGPLDYTITASVVSGPSNQNSGGYNANAGLTATISGVLNDNDGAAASLVTNPAATIGDIGEGEFAPLNGVFSVALSHRPVSDVVVSVIYSDPSLIAVFGTLPSLLTFTTHTWDSAQNVDFQAGQDIDSNDNDYTITLDVISGPGGYGTLADKELTGTIIDDEASSDPGFTISGGGLIAEGIAAGRDLEVVLDLDPTAAVELTVHTADAQLSLDQATLTFTTTDWNVTQTVNVAPIDDDFGTGTIDVDVTVTVGVRAGPDVYTGLADKTETFSFRDDEMIDIVVDPASAVPDLSEDDSSTNVQVKLASLPYPGGSGGGNVILTVTSSDPTAATVFPSLLTFTSVNATLDKAVAVIPVDDSAPDGNQDYIITIAVVDASSNDAFDDIADKTLMGTVVDDDIGLQLSTLSLDDINENGGETTFTVALQTQPSSAVMLMITSSPSSAVSLSDSELTFTGTTWSVAQTITVTGVNNDDAAGNVAYMITVRVASGPSDYEGLDAEIISGMVIDDDIPGLTLDPSNTLPDITENGVSRADFTVKLNTQPSSDVELAVTSSSTAVAIVDKAILTFTNSNWDTVQTVNITGVNDDIAVDMAYTVTVSVASGPSEYTSLNSVQISGMVTNDDIAGLTLGNLGPLNTLPDITENGVSRADFTVKLNTQPSSDVELAVTSSSTAVAIVDKATVTFTNSNWEMVQTVNITGVNDDIAVDMAYTVTVSVASGPSEYTSLNSVQISGMVTNDDTAGFTLSETGLGTISEAGGSTSFTVVLDAEPSSNVELALTTSGKAVSLSAATLTFTSGNWNNEQTVMVTGENNDVADGDLAFAVTVAIVDAASDDNFDGLNEELSGIVSDDDTAGINIMLAGSSSILSKGDKLPELLPEGSALTFNVALSAKPKNVNTVVTLSFTLTTTPTMATADLPTISPTMLMFTSINWNVPEPITVSARAENEIEEADQDYVIKIITTTSSSNTDQNFNDPSFTLTGTAVDDVGLSEEGAVQSEVAAAVADTFGTAQLAANLISARIQAPSVSAPEVSLAGRSLHALGAATQQEFQVEPTPSSSFDEPWNPDSEHEWSTDFGSLVPGTEFVLPLTGTGQASQLEFWGSVGYTDLQGDPKIDGVPIDYEGDARGVQVGLSQRLVSGVSWGLAVGSSQVEIDIEGNELAKIERDLWSIHPYVGWSPFAGLEAWLIGGVGTGDYDIELANNSDPINTTASMLMLGGGLQRSWQSYGLDWTGRLEGVTTRSDPKDTEGAEDILETSSAWRARAELEVSRTYVMATGTHMQPHISFGYRQDGGDIGSSGAGEVGLGLRTSFDDAWTTDLSGRFQVSDADHEQHSYQGYLSYDRGADRRGLLFSMGHSLEAEDATDISRFVTSSLGYGWSRTWFGQRGIVGVYLETATGDDQTGPKLSWVFEAPDLQLGVDGSSEEMRVHFNYISNW